MKPFRTLGSAVATFVDGAAPGAGGAEVAGAIAAGAEAAGAIAAGAMVAGAPAWSAWTLASYSCAVMTPLSRNSLRLAIFSSRPAEAAGSAEVAGALEAAEALAWRACTLASYSCEVMTPLSRNSLRAARLPCWAEAFEVLCRAMKTPAQRRTTVMAAITIFSFIGFSLMDGRDDRPSHFRRPLMQIGRAVCR